MTGHPVEHRSNNNNNNNLSRMEDGRETLEEVGVSAMGAISGPIRNEMNRR